MTSVRDIYDFLDRIAPFGTLPALADEDRSGLQTGDFSAKVEAGMVCLDVTPGVAAQAASLGCTLVVSHHPVLFIPRRQLLSGDPAWELARHNIACIATHIPLDACPGGVNDTLAELLGLGGVTSPDGLVRIGTLQVPLSAKALADLTSKKLSTRTRYCDGGKPIRTVAVCGGGGCFVLNTLYGKADAYVTGDAAHHNFLDAAQHGMTLVAAGHFETEHPVVPVLGEKLCTAFPNVKWHIADECGMIEYA